MRAASSTCFSSCSRRTVGTQSPTRARRSSAAYERTSMPPLPSRRSTDFIVVGLRMAIPTGQRPTCGRAQVRLQGPPGFSRAASSDPDGSRGCQRATREALGAREAGKCDGAAADTQPHLVLVPRLLRAACSDTTVRSPPARSRRGRRRLPAARRSSAVDADRNESDAPITGVSRRGPGGNQRRCRLDRDRRVGRRVRRRREGMVRGAS